MGHTFPNGKRWITDENGVQWRLVGGGRRPMRIKALGDPTGATGGYYCETPAEGITELVDGGYIDLATAVEILTVSE